MATLLAGVVALGAYLTWPARPCAGVQRAQVHQLSLETNEVFGFDLLALNGGGPAEIVSGGRRHDVTAGGIEIIELRPTDGPARLDLLAGADGAGQSLVLDPKSGNLVVRARLANGQVSTFSGPTEIYRRGTDWVALLAPGRRAPLRALHSGSEICWTNPIVRMLRLRGGTLEVVRWVDG